MEKKSVFFCYRESLRKVIKSINKYLISLVDNDCYRKHFFSKLTEAEKGSTIYQRNGTPAQVKQNLIT